MQARTLLTAFMTILAFILTAGESAAQVESILFSFANNGSDGMGPVGGLVFDASGNLYGTTSEGGKPCEGQVGSCGTVFELSPNLGGGWTQQVLYTFSGPDGEYPWSNLILDKSGNLYGTTYGGGTVGCGVVFELSPQPGGNWSEEVLYSFTGSGGDGCLLEAGLIFDAAGNLYGTTTYGGDQTCTFYPFGCGTVFELTPQPGGVWTEHILHRFSNAKKDGYNPTLAGLVFDAAGNLYGTTARGGVYGTSGLGGTVFELTPSTHGRWKEEVLHSFGRRRGAYYTDGYYPTGSLALDANGNLYGTAYFGGSYDYGTLFEVSPKPGAKGWTEKVLHNFNNDGTDGCSPNGSLVLDGAGNLYGTTTFGGAGGGGTVFELTPARGGVWTDQILHSFSYNGTDGNTPWSGLIFDPARNLYGTTTSGGAYGGGTVFEITP